MRLLPHINTRARIGETDFNFTNETLSYEIQKRTEIESDYGIISTIATTNPASPLYVIEDITGSNDLTVSSGGSVTPEGNIVYSNEEVALDISENGVEYTVFIEYNLAGIDSVASRYSKYEPKFFERLENAKVLVNTSQIEVDIAQCGSLNNPEVIQIDKTVNLSDPKTYTQDRLNNIVKLAVVSKTDGTIFISFDGTEVRPWYSPNDIVHRSKIGTGTPTDSNPHGIGISDFTVGPLSLFDFNQRSGGIVSKDVDFPGSVGRRVDLTQVATDAGGQVTFVTNSDNENKGVASTRPYSVAKVEDVNGNQYAFSYNKETGVLNIYEANTGIKYNIITFIVDACTPYISTSELAIITPNENEAVITEGVAVNTIDSNEISFKSNVIDRTFRCYLNESKEVVSNPSILGAFSIGSNTPENTVKDISADNLGETKIEVGFKTDNSSAAFSIEISGTLTDGSEATEEIDMGVVFASTTHIGSTEQYFNSVTSWKLIKTGTTELDVPSDTKLIFYANKSYGDRRRLAAICDVTLSGDEWSMKDKRIVTPAVNYQVPSQFPVNALNGSVAMESADRLKYADPEVETLDDIRNSIEYTSRMINLSTFDLSGVTTLSLLIKQTHAGSVDSIIINEYSAPGTLSSTVNSGTTTVEEKNDIAIIDLDLTGVSSSHGVIIEINGSFLSYSIALR